MGICSQQWTVTVSGTTGSGDSPRPMNGELLAIHLDYASGTNATTDATITLIGDANLPAMTLLTVTDNATDGWYFPRAAAVNTSNSAITNSFVCLPLSGQVRLGLAQSTDTKTVTITVVYED